MNRPNHSVHRTLGVYAYRKSGRLHVSEKLTGTRIVATLADGQTRGRFVGSPRMPRAGVWRAYRGDRVPGDGRPALHRGAGDDDGRRNGVYGFSVEDGMAEQGRRPIGWVELRDVPSFLNVKYDTDQIVRWPDKNRKSSEK
jgi:hypothetical protein